MGEAALELFMSQLSTTEHRADLDVVAVVAIELQLHGHPHNGGCVAGDAQQYQDNFAEDA
jgi:hypothetical protein